MKVTLLYSFLQKTNYMYAVGFLLKAIGSFGNNDGDGYENLACVAGAWKQRAKERTGAREFARPFFLVPTTSKRLLRRLTKTSL